MAWQVKLGSSTSAFYVTLEPDGEAPIILYDADGFSVNEGQSTVFGRSVVLPPAACACGGVQTKAATLTFFAQVYYSSLMLEEISVSDSTT